MELDNAEVAAFEQANAYVHDSAKAGASAVAAADDRALAAELAKLEGMHSLTTLWDLKKFFDSIDIPTLIELAEDLGFPLQQLAMSLIVHQAPRRLKLSAAIGDVIHNLGRSILAGCTNSTSMARAFMREAIGEDWQHTEQGVMSAEHVEDVDQLVIKSTPTSAIIAAASHGVRLGKNLQKLGVKVSTKTKIISNRPKLAKRLQNILAAQEQMS